MKRKKTTTTSCTIHRNCLTGEPWSPEQEDEMERLRRENAELLDILRQIREHNHGCVICKRQIGKLLDEDSQG